MSRCAPKTMQSRLSKLRRNRGLPLAPGGSVRELCGSPSASSPVHRSFARQAQKSDVEHRRAWSTHSLLMQPDTWRTTEQVRALPGCDGVLIYRCPSVGRFHRAPILPYFPCLPSVTRSVLIPRPSARRCSASAAPPCGSGFPNKNLPAAAALRARFFFGASQKAHLGTWERGTLASLRARVSRGQSGQIQTGEKQ
jgi:hypothetical protein